MYIRIFAQIYRQQSGVVVTDTESRTFKIQRGTKQGDPSSPNIFNAVLEYALAEAQQSWRRKGWGIDIGRGRLNALCNLRFADDIMLLATSRQQLQTMLNDVIRRAAQVGLSIHFGKTSIMNNIPDDERLKPEGIAVNGGDVSILPYDDSAMYLGRKLCFGDVHDTELGHRLACGWAKFHKHKSELCCRHFPLRDRLKLFEAVVTPTVLYSAGTWTMNVERERKLKMNQRRMLRKIVRVGRKPELRNADTEEMSKSSTEDGSDTSNSQSCSGQDTWVEWIRRATGIAEKEAKRNKGTDWVEGQRRRKWGLAGHTMRRDDGRWSRLIFDSEPDGKRRVGHPVTRWTDALDKFSAQKHFIWTSKAAQRKAWSYWGNLFAAG
jgi:hypothetical protein